MTTISSNQNKLKFYIPIVMLLLFFLGMGTFMIYSFVKIYKSGELQNKTYLMLLFGLFVYYLAYHFAISYRKKSPKIKVDNEKIIIKDKTYFWRDLQNIKLTGKKGFGFFNYQMEVATLNFNDKKTEYIYDDMYSNTWEIKSFIQQIVIDKKDTFKITSQNTSPKEIEKENFYAFKGNPVFSFRGLMMWGLISCFVYILLFTEGKISKLDALKAFVPLCAFWFLMNAYCMHYFELSKNYFVIKNHYFLWIKDINKISDIEEIVFESQGKQPNSLRIITKDFRRKLYPAGTLKDNQWLEMKGEFEKRNIVVRNECI